MVLFASYSGALGGAERLLLDSAVALDGEAALACPEGPLAIAARGRGLRTFRLRERSLDVRASVRDRALAPWRLVGHARELRRLADSLDPDVLVLWGMRPAIAGVLLGGRGQSRPRPSIVFHQNDLVPGRFLGAAVRLAAARADLVVAPSDVVAHDVDPWGRMGDRLVVVHPGVDVDRFAAGRGPAQPAEVVVVGPLVSSKRPELALEICALARRRNPGLRLRLVGAPLDGAVDQIGDALRSRAARSDLAGSVEFVGAVSDPAAELSRATCLLHCGEREAFGLAVLEALAAGRPAVVPDSGGAAEIVDDACGLRYRAGDAGAAAEAIERLLSEPELAARMGAAGQTRARELFDAAGARARWAEAVGALRDRAITPRVKGSIGVVTVTHDSGHVIGPMLESVERHLPGVQVVVVDNASSDETVTLAQASAVARVIPLDENVGFGSACNRGLREVTASVTALLNPDVELIDDSLSRLAYEAVRPDRAPRLLAPLVLSGDGSRQDSVHPAPGTVAELTRALVPFTRLPGPLAAPMAPWRASSPRCVGWAVGCALVARTDALRALGPFDERIFLYGEDLELGLRASDAGLETWFWPTARVVHHGAHTTIASFGEEPLERLATMRRQVICARRGARALALDDAAQALTFASRIIAKTVVGRSSARERQQLRALLKARGEAR